MTQVEASAHPFIATFDQNGRPCVVTCQIVFDGIEYVGRLWFTEQATSEQSHPDRAAIPGRTREAVIDAAKRLSTHELGLRHRRALAEKRRFLQLRRVTDEILARVRYLNQVAISARAGLLDEDGANQEIELTERQLHEFIDRLRSSAGAEE